MKRVKREVRKFIYHDLHKSGLTYEEIGKRLGLHPETVGTIVREERRNATWDDKCAPRGEYVGPWFKPSEIWEEV